jgi:hypothetical protein
MSIGSNWKEYTDFEFKWLETLLEREGLLLPSDVRALADEFQIKFTEPLDTMNPVQIGRVLLNDVPREKLLSTLQSLVLTEYSNMVSFSEANQIYRRVQTLHAPDIVGLLQQLPINPLAYSFVSGFPGDPIHLCGMDFLALVGLALEGFCRLPRAVALTFLQ